jgi:2-polyprenyl-6-hydroxyphenyl methylase/3-demethylubiquinone-9 3-methyltransferase
MLRPILDANRRMSRWLEPRLPQAREDMYDVYERTVARYMNAQPNQLVVDVGGGKSCPFAKYRRPELGTRIVAVDISEDEIVHNRDVDDRRVGDITKELPFAPGEVDMVVSRSVLEHLEDLEAFIDASARVLKPGGMFIHLLPSRFAPFAVLNRALPNWLSRRIVYFFHPETVGINGFPAFYDRCYDSALSRLLAARGFATEECKIGYYQSQYFNFLFPLYVVSVSYEMLMLATRARNLGAYILIVARKQ